MGLSEIKYVVEHDLCTRCGMCAAVRSEIDRQAIETAVKHNWIRLGNKSQGGGMNPYDDGPYERRCRECSTS